MTNREAVKLLREDSRYKPEAKAKLRGAEALELLDWMMRNCIISSALNCVGYESLNEIRAAKRASGE